MRTARRGFTLIELSVVLVIIGLIVGGVLVGRDLIHAAQLRSVISDIEKFNTAVNTFETKYNCLPGDCANATAFFGASTNCTGWTTSIGAGTCNGNGDGIVEESATNGNYTYIFENLLFWQHLSLAGLIPGSYSGLLQASPEVPYSRISNTCYSVGSPPANYLSMFGGYTFPSIAAVPNVYAIGSVIEPDNNWNSWASCVFGTITAADAYSIDAKIDDGLPDTGVVTTMTNVNTPTSYYPGGWGVNPCVTSNVPPSSWNLSFPNPWCMLIFKTEF